MFNVDKFQKELFEEFYLKYPHVSKDADFIKVFVDISSKAATLAVEKYAKENCSECNHQLL